VFDTGQTTASYGGKLPALRLGMAKNKISNGDLVWIFMES
jgi:hypothetical protein